jgi:hypothetical protein
MLPEPVALKFNSWLMAAEVMLCWVLHWLPCLPNSFQNCTALISSKLFMNAQERDLETALLANSGVQHLLDVWLGMRQISSAFN